MDKNRKYPISLVFYPDKDGNVTIAKGDIEALVKVVYGMGKEDGNTGVDDCPKIYWE